MIWVAFFQNTIFSQVGFSVKVWADVVLLTKKDEDSLLYLTFSIAINVCNNFAMITNKKIYLLQPNLDESNLHLLNYNQSKGQKWPPSHTLETPALSIVSNVFQ